MFNALRRRIAAPPQTQQAALTRHFFRRFFQPDSSAGEDAAGTTVVRSLATIAAPMLMAAFWIVTLARGLKPWDAAGIHYLFVLYSFCAMGCIATAQWDTLFPERIDFLILLPMPLRAGTMFVAKLQAVGSFLAMFLVAANGFAALLMPVLYGRRILVAMLAQGVAVMTAGMAATLAVLALQAAVIVLTPERWFARVAPLVQTGLVALFLLLFFRMGTVSEHIPALFSGSVPAARWFPPLWFLALEEVLLGGITATPYAPTLARQGLLCIPMLLVAVAALYPLAWVRRRRMALEGVRSARLRDGRWWTLTYRTLLQSPDQRAVFHFVRQTLTRLGRYHVYLAIYCGAGLALGLALAIHVDAGRGLHVGVWMPGTQAAMPLLLFWVVAGLRGAFLLPSDLPARWIFRMAPLRTQRVISTAKLIVFGTACLVMALVMTALAWTHWTATAWLQQLVYGLVAAVVLIDVFFFLESSIPFTRPRLPGRSNLPMTLAVYVFGMPLFTLLTVVLERWVNGRWWPLALVCAGAIAVHALMHWLRRLAAHPASDDAFLGENEEAFTTLGLSG